MINATIVEWLGVPRGLSGAALYCKKARQVLPFKSVSEKFKIGKARLAIMFRESANPNVRGFQSALKTGRK